MGLLEVPLGVKDLVPLPLPAEGDGLGGGLEQVEDLALALCTGGDVITSYGTYMS